MSLIAYKRDENFGIVYDEFVDVDLELDFRNEIVEIKKLVVEDSEKRGYGIGTNCIKMIENIAKQEGYRAIALTPFKMEDTKDIESLTNWYKKLGFKEKSLTEDGTWEGYIKYLS